MKVIRHLPEHVNIHKAAAVAVVINVLQAVCACLLSCLVLLDTKGTLHRYSDILVIALSALVISGAVMDVRDALSTRRMAVKMQGLHETVGQMSDLNIALRTQRHDFLNHLQVVYSLMEMEEYEDASRYIEQVYGDIRAVSGVMKTQCAPVNALIRAKTAECGEAGLRFECHVTGPWKDLPLPAWEMCRVLSNLIDNARDALQGQRDGRIDVYIGEDLKNYTFRVENNGPRIPEDFMEHMFEPGVSRKGDGRGMGLHIARETLRGAGGDLSARSDETRTLFSGFVPKGAVKA